MSKKIDPLIERLKKEKDPDKVIYYLVAELKRLRAMVRTMKAVSYTHLTLPTKA